MQIDRERIARLAELARLHVDDDRLPALQAGLQRLVDAFSALAAADLGADADDARPDRPLLTPASLRADTPDGPVAADAVLDQAPQRAADCFVVPRVVEP